MKRCPYCMVAHNRKRSKYCSPEHAKRTAVQLSAAGAERARARRTSLAKQQERSRVQTAYRQLAMGTGAALGAMGHSPLAVIYNPVLRKRRRKLGLLHEPE